MAQESGHPEEKLLEELKKEYTSQGILQARTPREKMTQNINTADEILRSEHLSQESTVESLLAQVTMKMSASQKLQGMIYLTKRISSLLEGGDEDETLLPGGEVAGRITDLPTVADLVDKIMREAEATLRSLSKYVSGC